MNKFRAHKGRIINSKRDSQKLDQLQLTTLFHEQHPNRAHFSIVSLLHEQMHQITEKHYKLKTQPSIQQSKAKSTEQLEQTQLKTYKKSTNKKQKIATPNPSSIKKTNRINQLFNQNCSPGQTSQPLFSLEDESLLGKTLDLMTTLNLLQQKKKLPSMHENEQLSKEIKSKLIEFKQLFGCIENKTEQSMLDFYNEQTHDSHSPNSFNSRNSDQEYQETTERQIYEMADMEALINNQTQQQMAQQLDSSLTKNIQCQINEQDGSLSKEQTEGQIEIKYRRINTSNESFDENNDTFVDEIEVQEQMSPQQDQQTQLDNESSIVHLFSYSKQKCLISPLPSITERSSQYCSPESKNETDPLFSQSLEYKKIFYLLQTSEKKKQPTTASNRHEISEFLLDSKTNRQNNKTFIPDTIDRSRCHSQLKDMIHLLETKYKRKVKTGAENVLNSLNAALNSKTIRPRNKK